MITSRWIGLAASALILTLSPLALAQGEDSDPAPTAPRRTGVESSRTSDLSEMFRRLENLAQDGRLPAYEDLRVPGDVGRQLTERYLQSLPLMQEDFADRELIEFGDVDPDSPLASMDLLALLNMALENNFGLVNARRTVEIRESEVIGAEAFFKPFVDLVSSASITQNRDREAPSAVTPGDTTSRTAVTYGGEAGIEARQNLPTGGSLTADFFENRFSTRTDDDSGAGRSRTYGADAGVRFNQPLLRGSGLLTGDGMDIGTANLRRTRLSQINQLLEYDLTQRDVVLRVVQQYFDLLRFKQELLVSREAIRERYRFLDETRIRYEVGRVAESEILRAEIQFLTEVERALSRQQQLDNARENLLITLGLPLDVPISIIDVTDQLADRGRVEIPDLQLAQAFTLNNRYELMQADISIALSEISRDLARNDVLPNLDFTAGARTFDSGDSFSDANEFNRDRLDAGVSLRVPLQNIQRREASRRAGLRYDQSLTDRLSLERNLTREVIQAHRSVLSTEARLTVLREQVRQARRNLQLVNDSFEVGFATITEVRLAQDDLFDAEVSYSTAILGYQVSIAQLYVAMGLPLI